MGRKGGEGKKKWAEGKEQVPAGPRNFQQEILNSFNRLEGLGLISPIGTSQVSQEGAGRVPDQRRLVWVPRGVYFISPTQSFSVMKTGRFSSNQSYCPLTDLPEASFLGLPHSLNTSSE